MRVPETGAVPASPAGRGETRTAGRDGLAGSGPSWRQGSRDQAIPSLDGVHSTMMPDEVLDLLRLSARRCTGSASNACLCHPLKSSLSSESMKGPAGEPASSAPRAPHRWTFGRNGRAGQNSSSQPSFPAEGRSCTTCTVLDLARGSSYRPAMDEPASGPPDRTGVRIDRGQGHRRLQEQRCVEPEPGTGRPVPSEGHCARENSSGRAGYPHPDGRVTKSVKLPEAA